MEPDIGLIRSKAGTMSARHTYVSDMSSAPLPSAVTTLQRAALSVARHTDWLGVMKKRTTGQRR